MLTIHLKSILLLAAFSNLVSAQEGLQFQSLPNCALPATTECLVKNSQYTVVGTVLSTTIGTNNDTQSKFSVQLQINCVWASFIAVSDGVGLVGNRVTVANWGFPHVGCPAGYGSTVEVGQSGIFFIYVAKPAPRSAPPSQAIFAVTHICAGPSNLTDNVVVAKVLSESLDQNAISAENRGTASFCTLPIVKTVTPDANTELTENAASQSHLIGAFALFLFSCILVSSY